MDIKPSISIEMYWQPVPAIMEQKPPNGGSQADSGCAAHPIAYQGIKCISPQSFFARLTAAAEAG